MTTFTERKGFQLSPGTISKIKALPSAEQAAIASALAYEFILGEDPRDHLNPIQMVLYTFVRFSVNHDNL